MPRSSQAVAHQGGCLRFPRLGRHCRRSNRRLGAVTTNLGSHELQVIAAVVIGGANLGGIGTAFGALIRSALIEVIRNSPLLHQRFLARQLLPGRSLSLP
jgi:predicted ABC-type sugar transport system permease subunit